MGWRDLMAPVRQAGDRLGPILPDVAAATGLDPPIRRSSAASTIPTPRCCRICLRDRPPFAVVSTGTWVIVDGGRRPARSRSIRRAIRWSMSMRFGEPVPSARFMGGREFSTLTAGKPLDCSGNDVLAVLETKAALLPSTQRGSGPFPHRAATWLYANGLNDGQRFATISFYLALMTATCLELIGGEGATIVEGPFARNRLFAAMLTAATGREVFAAAGSATGTSLGAALWQPANSQPRSEFTQASTSGLDARLQDYFEAWQRALGVATGQPVGEFRLAHVISSRTKPPA